MTLSRESIINGLVAQGVPRDRAAAVAETEIGREQLSPSRFAREGREADRLAQLRAADPEFNPFPTVRILDPLPAIEWPLRLIFPWSLLVSDNDREQPYIRHTEDGPRPAMKMTARCKEAREKIQQLVKRKLAGAAAAEIPLALDARVWLPSGSFRSDVANFAKATHDALEGIVYKNDQLLYDARWRRVGIDVDAPRAELTITPIVEAPASGG